MKKFNLLVAVLLMSSGLFAQSKWRVDKAHAKVGFAVKHLMLSTVDGYFKKFDASIISSKEDFSDAVFEVTIETGSVSTDNDARDKDLRSAHFFDVTKFPQITFKSTSVNKVDDKTYKVTGNLTIHGVTKPVKLDLTSNSTGKSGATKQPVTEVKVTGKINRTDFGVGSDPAAMIGDEITLKVDGEFEQE
jgi:polyisoprenoid-binding protein YceI